MSPDPADPLQTDRRLLGWDRLVPYLSFRSRNLERAVDFLFGRYLRFDVPSRYASALDVRVSGVSLPDGLYIGLTEYGVKASIEATPRRDDYWLIIPTRGQMATSVHRQQYVSDTRRAFLFSYPSMGPSRIDIDAEAARIMVVLSQDSLRRQLAALLGRPPDAPLHPPLEFAPVVDLTRGPGRSIATYARLLLANCERGYPSNPIALNSFEQFVISELLLSHSHNYTYLLYGRDVSVGPRDLKRAVDYMEANLDKPLTLNDIVEVSGVPGRTLLKQLRDVSRRFSDGIFALRPAP